MKVTTLNIQAAGLARATHLLRWLEQRDDEVIILTETTTGPGTHHLLTSFQQAGWHAITGSSQGSGGGTGSSGTGRGCAILSRPPLQATPILLPGITIPERAVGVDLVSDLATDDQASERALTVVGLYVPSNDRRRADRKRGFLASVSGALAALPAPRRRRLVVAGDYNLITRDHQPPHPGVFAASDYAFLDALAALDLVDAHQHLHPGEQPHSWIGHRGHAYRYDYIHLSAALAPRLTASTYQHEVRLAGLSDHAAVSIELTLEPTRPTARPDQRPAAVSLAPVLSPGSPARTRPRAAASRRSG